MAPIKVAILGATGETGTSIVNGLLESTTAFEITSLTRPSSLTKPQTLALQTLGITIIPYDADTNEQAATARALRGIDVVIAAVGPDGLRAQLPLATAAKAAVVRQWCGASCHRSSRRRGRPVAGWACGMRYVLWSSFSSVFLSSTSGCGCTASCPRCRRAGRRDERAARQRRRADGSDGGGGCEAFCGAGGCGRADSGSDGVCVYEEVVTPNAAYDLMGRMNGEEVRRRYLDGPELLAGIAKAKEKLTNGSVDAFAIFELHVLQYYYSIGVRGDNTPEYAEHLGYLDGKKLYSDLVGTSLKGFFQSILDVKAQKPYANRS